MSFILLSICSLAYSSPCNLCNCFHSHCWYLEQYLTYVEKRKEGREGGKKGNFSDHQLFFVWRKQLRHREVSWHAQRHTASEGEPKFNSCLFDSTASAFSYDHSLPCWLSCLHGWRFPEIIFLLSALKVSQPFLWLLPSSRYFLCYINLSFVALGFFYRSLKLIQERCLSFQSILYPTPKAVFERKDGYLRFSLCTPPLLPLFVYQQHVRIFRMNT